MAKKSAGRQEAELLVWIEVLLTQLQSDIQMLDTLIPYQGEAPAIVMRRLLTGIDTLTQEIIGGQARG
jgi:hypothetical protein